MQARDFSLLLGRETKIMGILNLSPDSFSHDGFLAKDQKDLGNILARAQRLIKEGSDILDIGGESTRPGSRRITIQEEISRVIPVLRHLVKKVKVPVSIDTYKPAVARHALDAGASIVNNIKGTQLDPRLLKMVQRYDAVIILMHMRGRPETMQKDIHFQDVVGEVISELQKSVENCLEIGIRSDRIIVDPGIGFGKTISHNLELINRLKEFQVLGCPILIGPSRKAFIGQVLQKDVRKRLMGTAAAVCASVLNGAHIIRVHDAGPTRDCTLMTDALLNHRAWQTVESFSRSSV